MVPNPTRVSGFVFRHLFLVRLRKGLVVGVGAIGNRILNQGYAEARQCVEDVMAVEHILIKHRLVEVLGEVLSQSVEGFGRPCLPIGLPTSYAG